MNLIHEYKERLKERHYVRKATKRWWFDLPKSRIEETYQNTAGCFYVILYGSIRQANDFYAIPYASLCHLLIPETLAERSDTHGPRWVGDVERNTFSIRKCRRS